MDTSRPSRQAVIEYLRSISPVVAEIMKTRDAWLKDLDEIISRMDSSSPASMRIKATEVGQVYPAQYERLRSAVARIEAPTQGTMKCQEWLIHWIQELQQATATISDLGRSGDLSLLSKCRQHLGRGVQYTQLFNKQQQAVLEHYKLNR
ncbi:MAG: hypothetical protein HYY04_17665 [Chloroflexi bacterium]|nr:hypothetical protein [Chloroflexota bacterium]